jgi:hypothetical protein
MMKYPRTSAVAAALLGIALSGCQPAAGPLTVESSEAGVPRAPSSELTAIVQAALEDRNGTALEVPLTPHLADPRTTAAYRAKRARPPCGGSVKGRIQLNRLLVHGLFDDGDGGVNRGDRFDGERPFQEIDRGTPRLDVECPKQRPVRLLVAADCNVPGIGGRMAARQHYPVRTWGRLADVRRGGLRADLPLVLTPRPTAHRAGERKAVGAAVRGCRGSASAL